MHQIIQVNITINTWKTYASTATKNTDTGFRSIFNHKIDHYLRTDAQERYAKREELIANYEQIKSKLNYYDNLPTAVKTIPMSSALQYLGKLWNNKKVITVTCYHTNQSSEKYCAQQVVILVKCVARKSVF